MFRILNRYYPGRNIAFFFIESLVIFLSVVASAYIRFGGDITLFAWYKLLLAKALLITIVCQGCLYYNELYDFKVVVNNVELLIRLFQAIGASYIILALIYYILPGVIIGRGIFLINLFLVIFLIVSWRLAYNWILKTKKFDQKIVFVGDSDLARMLTGEIQAKKDSGFQIMGVIDSGFSQDGISSLPILGNYGQLSDIVEKNNIERIVVTLLERRGTFPADELLKCKLKGVAVEEGISFYERFTGKLLVGSLYPSWLIFSSGFKKSEIRKAIKRITGVAISVIGLILSLPLAVIAAIAIKFDSPGPVILKQERVGENGKIFNLFKFRSMFQNSEENGEAVWATENDPRITRVGRIIRKIRIDEIPQMLNVLKGDMSFVGPRPERPQFVEELEKQIPYYSQRHSVKPGITGWAQIMYPYGSSVKDAREKLHYDLYYIKNLTIFFDLMILFNTIRVILFGKGAR
jgi:sugar transferase (PEP-CTERM system associated)